MSIDPATATQPTATVTVTAPAPIKAFSEGDDGPSFKDVIDIINPLQHIPIINTIYRHLTGDEEGAVADVGGGALYMGPVGLVGSLVDLAVKAESGKSIGDNILSWLGLGDDDDAPAEAAQTAQAQQQIQQQQQAQQTAAATAPLPAITAQALAPLPARQRGDDRKDADRRDGKDAAAKVGDYMVFGAAGSGQPLSLLPNQPDTEIAAATPANKDPSGPSHQGNYLVFGGAQQQTPAAASVSATTTASTDSTGIGRQGDYMVFGVSVPATPAARPVQLAQAIPSAPAAVSTPVAAAPMAPASASVTPQSPLPSVGSSTAAPASATPPGLSPVPARTFAAPARRIQVTPNALPMPTTGPAAIPGHMAPSQAIPAQAMTEGDASWFVNAMNNGLNKYAAAQKLADQSGIDAASTAAGTDISAQTFATIH